MPETNQPALPSFPIDVFVKLPVTERPPYATIGRVYDLDALCAGGATWDSMVGVVFTLDGHRPLAMFLQGFKDGLVRVGDLDVAARRFVALDDPRLYPAMGVAVQGNHLEAIRLVRSAIGISVAEAKGLIEAVLAEGAERGSITGVTLKDGRTVVVRQQDDDEAKERERKSLEDLRAQDVDGDPLMSFMTAGDFKDMFGFGPMNPTGHTLHVVTGIEGPKSKILGPGDGYAVDLRMNTTQFGMMDPPELPDYKHQAEPADLSRVVDGLLASGARVALVTTDPWRDALETGPKLSLSKAIPTYADLVLSPNRSESSGPLRMETLKARANPGGEPIRFVTDDDFKDAVMAWSLNPAAEKYEKLRAAEVAGGFDPGEQIRAANTRADRLQAVLDAETGRKGLDGWVFQSSEGVHAWTFERDEINFATAHARLSANGSQDVTGVFFIESNLTIVRDPSDWSCIHFQPTDALDGMEKATALLREYGVIPS